MDEDYALALRLQSEIFSEDDNLCQITNPDREYGKEPKSLVDPYWEMTDPNPDIRALFLQFNDRFFWSGLSGIEVKWSPRMTLCAGLCCYEGRGGLCSVRLSVPLLKLRPRKDLVETLLHEMIHAYLFITDNNKDHDGHGPEFHKHMYRINGEAGTKISVYHNFHDEVDAYRQHWWRCDGPCQSRKPYFGYVKRSMNRAPSKNDTWWAEHQRTCGGTYTKVKEPEGYGKKKSKDKSGGDKKEKEEKAKPKSKNVDIRIFGGTGKILGAPKGSIAQPENTSMISVPVKAPVTGTSSFHNNDSPSTSYVHDNFSDSDDCDVIFLPGGKTPDKKFVPKNKPVSQGGGAKFVGGVKKKNKVIEFDWSDSEDDEILLNYSKSVESKVMHKPSISSIAVDSSDVSDDEIITSKNEGCDKSEQSEKNFPHVADTDLHDSKQCLASTNAELVKDASVRNAGDASDTNSDVRAMLRKVWGEKLFCNNRDGIGVKSKLFKSGNQSVPVKRLSSDSDLQASKKARTSEAMVHSACNETSKTGSGSLTDAVRTFFADSNLNSSQGDVKSGKPKVTSPIEKMFNKMREKQTQDAEKQIHPVNPHSGEGSQTNAFSDTERRAESSSGDNSGNDNVTMSSCPVCYKMVETSMINEHLDLCLTMQALA